MVQFIGERLEVGREKEDALGLKGAANAGEGGGELILQESESLRGGGAVPQGAFENVDEHEASFLEFGEDFLR